MSRPGSVLSTYRTPPIVIRQIELELTNMASENPSAALDLADLLWDILSKRLAKLCYGRLEQGSDDVSMCRLKAMHALCKGTVVENPSELACCRAGAA